MAEALETTLDDIVLTVESNVTVRDEAKREIDARLMPWDTWIETVHGPEKFAAGAFADAEANPSNVFLMEPDHEARLGIGQDGRPVMRRRAVGVATHLENRKDGEYATFKVARTAAGDEVLALAADGVYRGISVEVAPVNGGIKNETVGGRRGRIHVRSDLRGASTTYQPAYAGAQLLAVRAAEGEPVSEQTAPEATAPAAPVPAVFDAATIATPIATEMRSGFDRLLTALADKSKPVEDRLVALEEARRSEFDLPNVETRSGPPDDFGPGDWLSMVLKMFAGEKVPQKEIEARTAADLITTDNIGVVPPAYLQRIIGVIDNTRPFLESTTRLETPANGMSIIVPKIVTRPTTGVQANEKDELTSTTTSITNVTTDATTIGGYGDISIQLLRRSSPSYLALYLDLLAEAYAIDADDKAVDVLLADGTVNSGGAMDPENISLGPAWRNGVNVSRRLTPDHIWLSTDAVVAFIDAKTEDGRAPLYTSIQSGFDVPGGPGGRIMGLIPVHVPALDDESVDIVVGPSRGFAWAEDGTFTLQVDVPAKAGRDVALVGMIWPVSLYGAAFTKYTLGGS